MNFIPIFVYIFLILDFLDITVALSEHHQLNISHFDAPTRSTSPKFEALLRPGQSCSRSREVFSYFSLSYGG